MAVQSVHALRFPWTNFNRQKRLKSRLALGSRAFRSHVGLIVSAEALMMQASWLECRIVGCILICRL